MDVVAPGTISGTAGRRLTRERGPSVHRRPHQQNRLRALLATMAALALVLAGQAGTSFASSHTSPFGQLDAAFLAPSPPEAFPAFGGIKVRGWAIDPDTTNSIYVWVTVDGVGRHVLAAGSRPDVGAAFPAFGSNRGFDQVIPAGRGTHRVCATAHNVGPGTHTLLGCRSVTVPSDGSPIGNFESAVGVVGGVDVKGWVIDPDQAGGTYAWVTVDGVGRHLPANVTRPDVGAVFPGYGPDHGFAGTIATSPGLHTVCVAGHNVAAGTHTGLGCRHVVAGSEQCPPFGTTAATSAGSRENLSSIYGATMRTGRHPCFERFVFEFAGQGPVPWWSVDPTRTVLFGEPRGPINPPIAGTWYLLVSFGAWDSGEVLGEAPLTPRRIVTSGFTAIKEVRTLGAFEGISELAIGVDNTRPYRVTWLESPTRLVVDVFTGIA